MKIMFINSVVDFGSTGRIVRALANEFKKNGHQVKIAYGRNEMKGAPDAVFIGNRWSTYFHVGMTRLFGNAGLHSKKSSERLIQEIKVFQPDLIHIHNLHGYYLHVPYLMEFLKTYPAKYVWTLHDAWSISGGTANFNYLGCEKWEDGCVITKDPRDYPAAYVFPNQERNFAWKKKYFSDIPNLSLVSPSHWLKNLCNESFLRQYEHEVIPNGIDLNRFRIKKDFENKFPHLQDKFIILGVASYWGKSKGLDHFIELAQKLDNDARIILIGLDEKNKRKLDPKIIAIPRTNDLEELVDYYNLADVFMNPTLDDNFPTTNLEALACGTPVITFNTGGSPEAIDESTGIVTKEKTADALRSAIDRLQAMDIKSENCRERAESLYSKELFSQRYMKLFLEKTDGRIGERK